MSQEPGLNSKYKSYLVKPCLVSKILDVPVKDVYYLPKYKPRATSTPMYRDPEILNAISLAIHSIWMKQLTVKKIQDKLTAITHLSRVPSLPIIQKILHESFELKHALIKPENIRYNDSSLNDKRLWVARLLTQLFKDDVILISIDESGFQ